MVQRLVDRLWLLTEQGVGAVDEQDLLAVLEEGYGSHPARALGPGALLAGRQPQQRTMYLHLFRRYMVQTFVQRLRQYVSNDPGQRAPAFQVVASRPVGNGTFSCSRACYRPAASPCGSTGGCGIDRRGR